MPRAFSLIMSRASGFVRNNEAGFTLFIFKCYSPSFSFLGHQLQLGCRHAVMWVFHFLSVQCPLTNKQKKEGKKRAPDFTTCRISQRLNIWTVRCTHTSHVYLGTKKEKSLRYAFQELESFSSCGPGQRKTRAYFLQQFQALPIVSDSSCVTDCPFSDS